MKVNRWLSDCPTWNWDIRVLKSTFKENLHGLNRFLFEIREELVDFWSGKHLYKMNLISTFKRIFKVVMSILVGSRQKRPICVKPIESKWSSDWITWLKSKHWTLKLIQYASYCKFEIYFLFKRNYNRGSMLIETYVIVVSSMLEIAGDKFETLMSNQWWPIKDLGDRFFAWKNHQHNDFDTNILKLLPS